MSKIIYPSKDEMNRQIRDILDQSELFGDASEDKDVLEYTEFAPINKKKLWAKSACAVAAAAAVVLVTVVAVNQHGAGLSSNGGGNVEPLGSIGEETTADTTMTTLSESESKSLRQEELSSYAAEAEEFRQSEWYEKPATDGYKLVYGKDMKSGFQYYLNTRIACSNQEYQEQALNRVFITDGPAVSYKGEGVSCMYNGVYNHLINDFMELKITRAYAALTDKWNAIYGENDAQTVDYSFTTRSINTHAGNPDIVSIVSQYDVRYRGSEKQGAFGCTIANNFDASSGYQLSLDDLFTDPEQGKKELFQSVYWQLRDRFENTEDQLSERYRLDNFDQKTGTNTIVSGVNNDAINWYFGENGIIIICNNVRGEDIVEYTGSIAKNYTAFTEFEVPYDELFHLKDEYRVK